MLMNADTANICTERYHEPVQVYIECVICSRENVDLVYCIFWCIRISSRDQPRLETFKHQIRVVLDALHT